ncbi:butyrate kinase [Pseudodesulfovibrio sp. zrk46]|uniref:butyrate kinase n=1 Tax=Pseudodesulfovibrio sp. zrk46 TaxID=2725288 RepID=UPI0014490C0D|nr:butyrate kinase [Pseudodesulfovibrio sp. zrk46]QJB56103.1 butyrate kinase [Pseudodesulfovibrio sp. zrk46]
MRVFVINPGSTSTKVALYDDGNAVVAKEFQHDKAELAEFDRVMEQHDFRMAAIRSVLDEAGVDPASMDGVAGRGGMLHALEGGVYEVNDEMLHDLQQARYGEHPCNLGAVLARELAEEWGVPAYIVDPVVTDELMDAARFTGLPGLRRRSLFHALNQRGTARTTAAKFGISYESSNFIVCHMGGGISIGAHRQGRVVDVINALDGEGPFSPERTGGLPVIPILDMVESGERSTSELKQIILREGGVYAHLGTNDLRDVVKRMDDGDEQARQVFMALAYGIARYMASLAPALADENGVVEVAGVVLTGGLARSEPLVAEISRMVSYLGPVSVVTGDEEMASLAGGAVRVLEGIETARIYVAEPV